MKEKIKLLFLSASPDRVRSDRELRDITSKIRDAPFRDAFVVADAWAVRTRDVQGILLDQKAQIVHFSGHGTHSRGILLEDEFGKPIPVNAPAIRGLFEPLRGITKVVLLNACATRPLAKGLRDVVDHIITTRRPITDRAAIVFATQFYSGLAYGLNVPDAFHSAVNQLRIGETAPEADIPELVSREGTVAEPLVKKRVRDPKLHPPKSRGIESYTTNLQGARADGPIVVATGKNNKIDYTVQRKGRR